MSLDLAHQAEHECWIKLTRVGMRIEWFLKDNGHLPDSLDAIIDEGEEVLLRDPFTGDRFIYKTIDDSTYALYSTGYNREDDGGVLHARANGDLVWYPQVAYWTQFYGSHWGASTDASPPDSRSFTAFYQRAAGRQQ
jgi:hypothetical protein